MTIQSRINLKSNSETGDTVTQDLLDDIIDSFVSLADVTAQTMASNLIVPNIGTNLVSAGSGYFNNLFTIGLNTNQNPYVEYFVDATVDSSAAASGTSITLDAHTTAPNVFGFVISSAGAQYTGTNTAKFEIGANIAAIIDRASEEYRFFITKNSAMVSASFVHAALATTHKNLTVKGIVQLNPNDFFQIVYQIVTTTQATIHIHSMNVIAKPIFWN